MRCGKSLGGEKKLQDDNHRQAVALAGDIAGLVSGAGAAEAVEIERAAFLELYALEAVSGPQAGIDGFPDDKAALAEVFHRDDPIWHPSQPELGPGRQGVRDDGLPAEFFRLDRATGFQLGTEILPPLAAGIAGQHVERVQGDGIRAAGGITPEALQRAFGEMLVEGGVDGVDQGDEPVMGCRGAAESRLHALPQHRHFGSVNRN